MREERDNIDELFNSELSEFSPTPPAGVWENIEQKLKEKQARKPLFYISRIAASIALLLATGSLGYYLITNSPNEQDISAAAIIDEHLFNEDTAINNSVSKKSTESINSFEDALLSEIENEETMQNEIVLADNQPVEVVVTVPENEVIVEQRTEEYALAELSSKRAELNTISEQEKPLEYNQQPVYSDVYKEFLSEFEELEEKDDRQKWAVGGQAGPQYTFRQISSADVSQELLDEYNQSENGLIAYAGGINVAYKPARRLSIQSGIYYSKMGHTSPATPVEPVNSFVPLPGQEDIYMTEDPAQAPQLRVASSLGNIQSANNLEGELAEELANTKSYENVYGVEQYLEYLEVPLFARYAIIDRKVNFHVLGGVSTNFLIASPVYLDNGSYYTETQNLNKVNYSSTVGLGLGYKFSSISVSIEPQFKYYLNKVNTSSSTDVHPYSFGIFTGVTYLF